LDDPTLTNRQRDRYPTPADGEPDSWSDL
jgi:hypothetical protein